MTRYEHIELDISTAACHNLMLRLQTDAQYGFQTLPSPPREELMNLYNELCARLQRRDVDPHCLKNFEPDLSGGIEL
jgi:hypothetical protein